VVEKDMSWRSPTRRERVCREQLAAAMAIWNSQKIF